jgi:lambda family phage portal protein
MGIRFSKDGEPEFYNILNKHPGEYSFSNNDMGSVEVPAFDADGLKVILHLFNKERPGQSRGIPMLSAVIKPIKDLGVYQDAEITAAVVSGMFAMFIESPDADVAENGLIPGMIKNGTSPAVDGAVPSAMGVQKLSPGMILEGMPGEKASSINPGRPSSAFEPFVNACLAQIGMGLGIPKEVFLKLYQTSFTAARAAILDAKKIWDLYRAGFATRVCQPTWEAVLFESVARGYLSAPGFLEDVEIRTAYTNCYWTGTPPGSVDPYKEAKAEELWMKLGIKTQQRVTQEQTGEDWAEVTAQRKIERDLLAQSNLTGGSNQMEKEAPASNPQKNNPEENDFQESEDDKENLPEDLKKEDE